MRDEAFYTNPSRNKGFYANPSRNGNSPDRKPLKKILKNCARDAEV